MERKQTPGFCIASVTVFRTTLHTYHAPCSFPPPTMVWDFKFMTFHMPEGPGADSVENDIVVSVLRTIQHLTLPPLPEHLALHVRKQRGQYRRRYVSVSSPPRNASNSFSIASEFIPDAKRYSEREPSADLMISAETAAINFLTFSSATTVDPSVED